MTMRIVGMCPRKRKVSVCVLDSHPDGLRFVKAGYHDVTREAIAAALSVFSGKESRRLIAVEVSPKYPVAAGICIGLSWPNQVGLMVSSELTRSMSMLLDVEKVMRDLIPDWPPKLKNHFRSAVLAGLIEHKVRTDEEKPK